MSTKSLYITVDKLLPAGSVPPITIYNGTLTQYQSQNAKKKVELLLKYSFFGPIMEQSISIL